MLQCKNVTKKYMKMTAVNGVSIDFMPGRIYALLGSNGSGNFNEDDSRSGKTHFRGHHSFRCSNRSRN